MRPGECRLLPPRVLERIDDREGGGGMIPLGGRVSGWREIALWVLIAVAAAVLTVVAFRAYLNPSALIDFANSLLC